MDKEASYMCSLKLGVQRIFKESYTPFLIYHTKGIIYQFSYKSRIDFSTLIALENLFETRLYSRVQILEYQVSEEFHSKFRLLKLLRLSLQKIDKDL